jgi:phospholipase/lecithinase/hemolysin
MKLRRLKVRTLAAAVATSAALLGAGSAQAVAFNDLFLFGDSYTDTGAYVPLTNGTTAAAYLGQLLGITMTTPKNAHPGTSGVNFAESGARISVGPTTPGAHPLSLTQQVTEFQNYVTSGNVTFNSSTTLFYLLGGLNDHKQLTTAQIQAATTSQVATLYSLGARYFEIADIPSLVPAFADSAAAVNPAIVSLIPLLKTMFPDAVINLSNWGKDFDEILTNPLAYGITNTNPAGCSAAPVCSNPNQYFYYYNSHPSDAAHRIVGLDLLAEVRAIPEPMSIALFGVGALGLAIGRRRQRRQPA